MTPSITDMQTKLAASQNDLLERVRSEIGPLVGASLSVRRGVGWFIKLSLMREITDAERSAIQDIKSQFDVPIEIEERQKPSRLSSRDRNARDRHPGVSSRSGGI